VEHGAGRRLLRLHVGNAFVARRSPKNLPEDEKALKQAIDLRFDLRTALLPFAEFERILEHLAEAETLAQRVGDQLALGWVSAYRDIYFWVVGDNERALEAGHRACAIADTLGDSSLRVVASSYLGAVYFAIGEFGRACELLQVTVTSLDGPMVCERFRQAALPSVFSRAFLAWSLSERGEILEAIPVAADGLRIAEAVNQPFTSIIAAWGYGATCLWKGDFARAAPVLERGLELVDTWNIRAWFPFVAALLGRVYVLSGRLRDGLALLGEAVNTAETTKNWRRALWISWLSEALLRDGQVTAAAHGGRASA
jgi:tetratricopeptide (TPR) repeat protein